MMHLMRFLWIAALLLGGCGYHLVGHSDGKGVIPEDVSRLILMSQGGEGELQTLALRDGLQTDHLAVMIQPGHGALADDGIQDARLLVQISPVRFSASAFDATGVASQYRMVYEGRLSLLHHGETIWQSGNLSEQGEVYVTTDPTSIEASRQQLLRNLRKQWLRTALGRIRSGF